LKEIMLISLNMPIIELIELMGETTKLGQSSRRANVQEAEDLRDLLVRDFSGRDTKDIADGVWMTYCCALDPEQHSS
jgi:hypothetical protein